MDRSYHRRRAAGRHPADHGKHAHRRAGERQDADAAYDKALDTGSTPANNAYTVTVAGQHILTYDDQCARDESERATSMEAATRAGEAEARAEAAETVGLHAKLSVLGYLLEAWSS